MTKQEELSGDKGLGGIELGVDDLCGILEGHTHLTPQGRCKILSYLHSQGVVIQVDRELPAMESRERSIIFAEFIKKAGLVAIEPLIKEGKS